MAYLIRGARVVDPQLNLDDVRDGLIEGNQIKAVGNDLDAANAEVVDATGKVLIPGMVDMHVHFRDPGFEYKETIETGSRAAAHGGFTDVATMPNTNPVADEGAEIRYQIDRGEAAGYVHIRPIGALTKGQKGEALAEIGDGQDALDDNAVCVRGNAVDGGILLQDAGVLCQQILLAVDLGDPTHQYAVLAEIVGVLSNGSPAGRHRAVVQEVIAGAAGIGLPSGHC